MACTQLGLDDYVTFTGRADKAMIADLLSVADVGLCPDLKTPLNDVSTMNKTMEYMSYALPAVAFDLAETRVSGGDAVTSGGNACPVASVCCAYNAAISSCMKLRSVSDSVMMLNGLALPSVSRWPRILAL